MMSTQDVTTLNTLIATTIDSANGFEEAARMANATGLASQFAELARDRWSIVETLEGEVQRLGSTPKRSGTAKAAAHRRWLDIRNAVAGSDRAVIQEVENGETYLVTKYETALSESGLSEMTRQTIQEAFSEIRRGQERVRGLGLTVGTTDAARQTHVDWRRIGAGLGIAAAIGGAAYAATRMTQSRRRSGGRPIPRRGTTVSIDRTDRTEIEARNAESTTGMSTGATRGASSGGMSSDMDRDTASTPSTKRSSGRRSSQSSDSASVGLAASGSTGGDMGVDGGLGLPTSTGTDRGGDTSGAGFSAGGSGDTSSGTGSTGSFGSTGGRGTDFNRS